MKRSLGLGALLGALFLALPAFASIWVTNRSDSPYDLEIKCSADKAPSSHRLEANTAANYSLPKGSKGCEITLKDKDTKTPVSRIDAEDGVHYEVSDDGKITRR